MVKRLTLMISLALAGASAMAACEAPITDCP